MQPTTKYQLIEERLGSDLDAFVLDLRQDGVAWTAIAARIERVVGVTVDHQTLTNWFGRSIEEALVTPTATEPMALSVADVAARVGLSKQSVYREVEDGRLRAVRIRGRLLVPADAVADWLQANKV